MKPMPRARSRNTDDWREQNPQIRTAAAGQKKGSGCLSGFMIPPLAVVLISGILAAFAIRQPIPAQALVSTPPTQPAAPTALVMQSYDGSGQPVPAGSQAGQVYDGSGQPVDPNASAPVPGPLYDGSGQPVQQSIPLYDGSGRLIVPATPATQGAIQAEIVNEAAPVSADPIRTPIWNFFPDSQPAVAAPANDNNAPAVLPAGSSASLAPFFRPEVLYWKDAILRWSAQAGLDPNLAAVVMQIESCGDPTALSRSGAIGLFQVMPFHFRSGDDPYDPDTNALRGLGYLARSMQSAGGDVRLALAGYNGGIGVIARGEWTWAAETARYVYFGWPIYQDAQGGLAQSAALDDWYNRYGANLCRQASQHQY
jgi:hypothetical protein